MMEYMGRAGQPAVDPCPLRRRDRMHLRVVRRHIEASVASVGPELEQIRAGKLRVLLCLMPSVPTSSRRSDGPGEGLRVRRRERRVLDRPAKTPKEIQRKLEVALLQAFKDPMVIDVLTKWNWDIDPMGSEALTQMIIRDYKANGELLKKFGMGIYRRTNPAVAETLKRQPRKNSRRERNAAGFRLSWQLYSHPALPAGGCVTIPFIVRQAHHERNHGMLRISNVAVRPELVEGPPWIAKQSLTGKAADEGECLGSRNSSYW